MSYKVNGKTFFNDLTYDILAISSFRNSFIPSSIALFPRSLLFFYLFSIPSYYVLYQYDLVVCTFQFVDYMRYFHTSLDILVSHFAYFIWALCSPTFPPIQDDILNEGSKTTDRYLKFGQTGRNALFMGR